MGKKALAVALGVAAVMGVKAYSRASSHDDVKQRLVALCDGEGVCEQAVETHFDACYQASDVARGGQSGRLETGSFVRCLNARADRVYIVYDGR